MRSADYIFYKKHSTRLGKFASFAGVAIVATIAISYLLSIGIIPNGGEIIQIATDTVSSGGAERIALEAP